LAEARAIANAAHKEQFEQLELLDAVGADDDPLGGLFVSEAKRQKRPDFARVEASDTRPG